MNGDTYTVERQPIKGIFINTFKITAKRINFPDVVYSS